MSVRQSILGTIENLPGGSLLVERKPGSLDKRLTPVGYVGLGGSLVVGSVVGGAVVGRNNQEPPSVPTETPVPITDSIPTLTPTSGITPTGTVVPIEVAIPTLTPEPTAEISRFKQTPWDNEGGVNLTWLTELLTSQVKDQEPGNREFYGILAVSDYTLADVVQDDNGVIWAKILTSGVETARVTFTDEDRSQFTTSAGADKLEIDPSGNILADASTGVDSIMAIYVPVSHACIRNGCSTFGDFDSFLKGQVGSDGKLYIYSHFDGTDPFFTAGFPNPGDFGSIPVCIPSTSERLLGDLLTHWGQFSNGSVADRDFLSRGFDPRDLLFLAGLAYENHGVPLELVDHLYALQDRWERVQKLAWSQVQHRRRSTQGGYEGNVTRVARAMWKDGSGPG